MSNALHLPESDCARARVSMPEFVDGDLGGDQSAWLRGHLERCAECRGVLAGFVEIDKQLTGWGKRLGLENPPPAGAREQLTSRLTPRAPRRRPSHWIPAAAGFAAAVLLAVALQRGAPTAGNRSGDRKEAAFIAIPYLAPLDPHENAAIVRMDIRVATLIAIGYRVSADPDAMVSADVLVGEDGRAHAVRVLSGIDWNGTGD